MPIRPDSPRAKEIAAKKAEIADLLRQDQFATNRSIAEAVGAGANLVKQVRTEITGPNGLIKKDRRPKVRAPSPEANGTLKERVGALRQEAEALMSRDGGDVVELTRDFAEFAEEVGVDERFLEFRERQIDLGRAVRDFWARCGQLEGELWDREEKR
jgi:hypothetical protein